MALPVHSTTSPVRKARSGFFTSRAVDVSVWVKCVCEPRCSQLRLDNRFGSLAGGSGSTHHDSSGICTRLCATIADRWRASQLRHLISGCYDAGDCLGRSKGNLGSSKAYPATATSVGGGIASQDCSQNPNFCNWNTVYLKVRPWLHSVMILH